jgi:hypothetical protein
MVAEGSSAIMLRERYGVVLGFAPWNVPFVLGRRASLQPLEEYGPPRPIACPSEQHMKAWHLRELLYQAQCWNEESRPLVLLVAREGKLPSQGLCDDENLGEH